MSGDDNIESAPVATGTDATQIADVGHAPTALGTGPALPDKDRLSPGDTAGDYRIIRRIGGGAMGDVYEGEAEAIGKRVAIKVIVDVLASSGDAAQRFLREARAVNRIDHPNVLDVFAFGQLADGRLYLVMDLLVGESLGQRLRRDGALDETSFLETIGPMCRAVDAAHAAGIIHRDLKPDNVFLAEQAGATHVYVLDFGIAKLLSDAAAAEGQVTLTGEGVWIGTPAYMSPEQWAAEPATARTDVYALGCTAFEMLSGRVPFEADSVPGVMQKHFNEALPKLERSAAGSFRRGLAEAIEVAMAKEPGDRHASAGAFLSALEGGPSKRPERASSRMPVAAALLSVLLLVVGGFVLWNRSPALVGESERAGQRVEAGDSIEPTPPAPDRWWSLTLETVPRNATISIDGRAGAEGRIELDDLEPGSSIAASVSAPGFVDVERTFTANEAGRQVVTLTPIKGFEGTWKLGEGRFRQLVRRADGVAVFHLEHESDTPQFLQTFRFTAARQGWVYFEGSVIVADERAPHHPSCQFELTSEYRYHAGRSALDFRRERAPVGFNRRTGECEVGEREKGPWEVAERVTTADNNEVIWAVSRAGGGLEAYILAHPRQPLPLRSPPPEKKGLARGNKRVKKSLEKGSKKSLLDELDALGDRGNAAASSTAKKNRAQQKSDAVKQRKLPAKEAQEVLSGD